MSWLPRWLHSRQKPPLEHAWGNEFVHQSPLPYLSIDTDGIIRYINPAGETLIGRPANEVVGRLFSDFLGENGPQSMARLWEQATQPQGEIRGCALRMQRRGGGWLDLSVDARQVVVGKNRRLDLALYDLTVQSQVTSEKIQSHLLLNSLFDDNPDVILLVEPQTGRIFSANPAACAFYGYKPAEFHRKMLYQVTMLEKEVMAQQIQVAMQRQSHHFSERHVLSDGSLRDVNVVSGPVEVHGRRLLYLLVHDETQQKRMEAETQRLQQALKQRLVALSQPLRAAQPMKFENLFDLEDIQNLQDAFSKITLVPSVITELSGAPITKPSNFEYLCPWLRLQEEDLMQCFKVAETETNPGINGPVFVECLSGRMVAAYCTIWVGEYPIANWWICAMVRGEPRTNGETRPCAMIRRTGLVYPVENTWTREKIDDVAQALHMTCNQLSKMALSNVQQARVIFEREQSYNKMRRINRLYQVHSTISRSAETARSAEELYRLVCQTLVGVGDFRLAWIGQLEEDQRSVTPVAWAGEEWGYLSVNKVTVEDTPESQGPVSRSIRENRLICCNDIQADAHLGIWRDAALERGYQSVTSFPLRVEDRVVGALTVYSEEANFFDAEQTDLLREVSLTLSFSLTAMEKERTRREAEQALQISEARYRRLFNNENDGVFVWPVGSQTDLHTLPISEVNPAFCERLGYSAEELLQMHPLDIYPVEERQTLQDSFLTLLEKGQDLIETNYLTKDGRRLKVEINARLFDQDGSKYLLCISRDISGRKLAEEKIQRQLRRISALRSIDHAINTRLPLSKIMSLVLDHAIEHLKVAAADIMIYDPETQDVYPGYTKGFQTGRVEAERFSYVNHALADPRRLGHPYRIKDLSPLVHTSREAIMAEEGFCNFYGATLMSNNQLLGFIEVFLRCEPDEDEEWINYFETLAGQAAIAINHEQMVNGLMEANQVLSRAYDETIEGWSRTMDLRDHDTEGHSERVTTISLRLGQALGLGEEDLLHMRWGALLHDIGKVGIPDGILLKPGPLDEDEWRIMKRHPQLAFDLLSPISFLRPALDIPFCHHEKWDGSGYPRGLKGEEIPLAARIFALADVWDALRSERPYRIGWSVEQTRAYIQSQIGLHFDPAIAEVFLRDINPE